MTTSPSSQLEAAWPAASRLPPRARSRTAVLDRVRPQAGLIAVLALAALLYTWGLSRSGYANDFYAAAVKSGTESWKAFFFGSLDPSNFITVDKPPAALWVMELSGRLFGFSSESMLLPQALEGVASVGLLYATVRRWFGAPAALLSGVLLALAPAAALMFRFNNPDALLLLLLVVAAYATTRALDHGGTWWLALAGAAVGFGFLTKMMEAFLVVPALALAYLVAAPASLPRRLWQLAVAGVALLVAGGWWVAVVELTPAADRPYVGGSTNNSIFDLIWGYNGLGRISGSGTGNGASFSGTPGILRLFNQDLGGQISWLLPAALIALAAGLVATLRRPRTDRVRAAAILWGGWLVVTGAVFSFMSGIIHPYYSNILAPAIAVLVGVGATLLWRERRRLAARATLAAMLIATAAWSFALLDRTPSWHPWLRFAAVAAGVGSAGLIGAFAGRLSRPASAALLAAALLAGIAGPLAYTLDTVTTAHAGSTPSAGPAVARRGGGGGGTPSGATASSIGFGSGGSSAGGRPRAGGSTFGRSARPSSARAGGMGGGQSVSAALAKLIGASGTSTTWAAATDSSMTAAPLELATGKAVMAIGGFSGSDPAITLARFKQLVAAGKIHYYVASGGTSGMGGTGGPGGRGGTAASIASWVASTFSSSTVGGTTVYDLTQTR